MQFSQQFCSKIIACKNSHFSLLCTAGDVLRGSGTSATQRQKFHTDMTINVYIILAYLRDFGSPSSVEVPDGYPNKNRYNKKIESMQGRGLCGRERRLVIANLKSINKHRLLFNLLPVFHLPN